MQAYKHNYLYPHYAWIIFGWYPDKWWTEEVAGEPLEGCTDEDIEDFLQKSRVLLIHLLPEPDNFDLPTVAGFVSIVWHINILWGSCTFSYTSF